MDDQHDYMNVLPLRRNALMRQKSDFSSSQSYAQVGARRRSASFKKVQRQRRQAEAMKQKVCLNIDCG